MARPRESANLDRRRSTPISLTHGFSRVQNAATIVFPSLALTRRVGLAVPVGRKHSRVATFFRRRKIERMRAIANLRHYFNRTTPSDTGQTERKGCGTPSPGGEGLRVSASIFSLHVNRTKPDQSGLSAKSKPDCFALGGLSTTCVAKTAPPTPPDSNGKGIRPRR